MPASARLLLLLLLSTLAACADYPRDSHGTLRQIDASTLRAGVSHDPPFVVLAPGREPAGSEVALVRALARTRGARIEWVPGGHDALMEDLLAFRVQLVAGGHTPRSPWAPQVAWSRPYPLAGADGGAVERRLALPPGENAWQMAVDRLIHANRRAMALQAAGRRP